MFLGPCPEGYRFLPKHKANSYAPTAQSITKAKEEQSAASAKGKGMEAGNGASSVGEVREAAVAAADAVAAAKAAAEDQEMERAVDDW